MSIVGVFASNSFVGLEAMGILTPHLMMLLNPRA